VNGRVLGRLARRIPAPLRARHAEWTIVASADDAAGRTSDELIGLLVEAAGRARAVELAPCLRRAPSDLRQRIDLWPGEHYRLLPALALALGAARAVELGTDRGAGSLCLRQACAVTTFDVVPWQEVDGTLLTPADFDDGLTQVVADVSDERTFHEHEATLAAADVILVDGPPDTRLEPLFRRLLSLESSRRRVIVLDDIRIAPRVDFWRRLDADKIDATTFGHWSGTGLVLVQARHRDQRDGT
jgi:predicted O-methyltransferase YrrM